MKQFDEYIERIKHKNRFCMSIYNFINKTPQLDEILEYVKMLNERDCGYFLLKFQNN